MVSRDVIFDEKSILEIPGKMDRSATLNVDSSVHSSQVEDRPSTSTGRGSSVEVELSRKDSFEVKDV